MPRSARSPFGSGRMTSQRATIAEAVAKTTGAFTVEALADDVRRVAPGIGVATVYRAVATMESNGWLERVGERDGAALYLHCSEHDEHHHHLVCTGCGRVELTECPLGQVDRRAGFVLTHHDVTLYGLCPACARSERS